MVSLISLRTHNILDYLIGAALMAAPFAFGFSETPFAMDAFVVVGMVLIGYSLITDYRYSLARIVPLGTHRVFDAVLGLFVMAAPFIYDYRADLTGLQLATHFAFGLGLLFLVGATERLRQPSAPTLPIRTGVTDEESIDRRLDKAA